MDPLLHPPFWSLELQHNVSWEKHSSPQGTNRSTLYGHTIVTANTFARYSTILRMKLGYNYPDIKGESWNWAVSSLNRDCIVGLLFTIRR